MGREDHASYGISLELSVTSKTNFACYQNDVPILREVVVRNDSLFCFERLRLELTSEPPFLEPKTWHIERLDADQRLHVRDLDVRIRSGALWELTEAVPATLRFRLRGEGRVLAEKTADIELLARNEWGGTRHMPEMVAAFVMPNDPAVDRILGQAGELLRKSGRSAALDGYASGQRQHVWEQVAAIWGAVRSFNIGYATPPASFEREGQKVRSPSKILESRVGTCLDLSLLFASCLEQCGLNPIVVFYDGHAFVGCWLVSEQFASVVIDDVTSLRKRLRLTEVLFWETTLATSSSFVRFGQACETSAKHLSEANDEQFDVAIDIRRARMQRIRPLTSGEAATAGTSQTAVAASSDDLLTIDEAPDLPEDTVDLQTRTDVSKPRGRLDAWQRRLLDLSLRNRLLNFRETKRSVRIRCGFPAELEDRLAGGKKLRIVSSPQIVDDEDGRSSELHFRRTGEDIDRAYEREALERNELLVDLPEDELEKRLVELYRAARTSLQEGGANTLFLAFGFLVWTRDGKGDRRFRAPLLLVPVALERRSVRAGFRLVLHDDEPRVNPTLLQMLEQDFGIRVPGLADSLPSDDAGLDVDRIYQIVTHAIRDRPGWEVVEDVVLATFSFAKYLMWKDLADRAHLLKRSPVVKHLIETPKAPYGDVDGFPEPRQLDRRYPPSQTYTVLSADSSQLAAILAAAEGKDFVLIGPPGTGKSQTIANMIAQCLAEGRTVLFVSQKTAALEVVYRRLCQVGLGEFCLELHSHKARKLEVLQQLRRAWEASDAFDPRQWREKAEKLKRLRDRLNEFVHRLHREHANGLTVFDAIAREVNGQGLPRVSFQWQSHKDHDRRALDRWRELMDRLAAAWDDLPEGAQQVFAGIVRQRWSPTWQEEFTQAVERLLLSLEQFRQSAEAFAQSCSLPYPPPGRVGVAAMVQLARALKAVPDVDASFLLEPHSTETLRRLKLGLKLLRSRAAVVGSLSQAYREDALKNLDVLSLKSQWDDYQQSHWLRRVVGQYVIRRKLAGATVGRRRPDCAADLARLVRVHEIDRKLASLASLSERTGGLWQGLDSDQELLEKILQLDQKLQDPLPRLARSREQTMAVRAALRHILSGGHEAFGPQSPVGRSADDLLRRVRDLADHLQRVVELAANSLDQLFDEDAPDWTDAVRQTCRMWLEHAPRLRAWCHWHEVKGEARKEGLATFAQMLENGRADSKNLRDIFDVNYCRWWVRQVIEHDDVLRSFSSAEHERLIEKFRKVDKEFLQLTRRYIRAKLCGNLPNREEVARRSEWGILKRELQKKRRHKPIRQLIKEMPTALTRLTPCLMMSPLSIAQYLPADHELFDVVIFDEASQIPVWDAIGAVARGRRAIIVGDPKQLPPTTFFERSMGDDVESDEDIEEDLESILDECIAANLPTRELRWHYRSRHESLIAFSNHHYYNGKLITFPSAATEDRAVQYIHVPNGVYERGAGRVNRPEAEALVAHLMSRLNDEEFRSRNRSIGVVTFNIEQQRLIEDLLDQQRRENPEIERYFSEDAVEPIFVKNLESVQGDERDIIYFSVTYGPDRHGRISMNFGPLNAQGGERRLNVAITRARQELLVFASLRPEQIDLSRTQAAGVRDFKHFLEYAERGPRVLDEIWGPTGADFESPFERSVAESLREAGWEVHPQIGVSGFRIDLGVVDPHDRSRYLAGIECDGVTYHRSATARDRDRLRQAVLENLGWNILRVWSIDWWTDRETTLQRLLKQLHELSARSRLTRPMRDERRTPSAELADDSTACSDELGQPPRRIADHVREQEPSCDSPDIPDDRQSPRDSQESESAGHSIPQDRELPPKQDAEDGGESDHDAQAKAPVPYRICDLQHEGPELDAARFFDPSYDSVLSEAIRRVIEVEGPIHEDLLVQRIARAHGFQRSGRQIRERVLGLAKELATITREPDAGNFYWPKNSSGTAIVRFRRAIPGFRRPAHQIVMPELCALAKWVLRQQAERERAIRVMADELGLRRIRAATRQRLEKALDGCVDSEH